MDMDTSNGPSYACLFKYSLYAPGYEKICKYDFLSFYRRCIDDRIGTTIMPQEDFDNFTEFVKTFNPVITFTSHASTSAANFLDILANGLTFLTVLILHKPNDSCVHSPISADFLFSSSLIKEHSRNIAL